MPESTFRIRVNIWAFERLRGEPVVGGGLRKTVSPGRAGTRVMRLAVRVLAVAAMAAMNQMFVWEETLLIIGQ